MPHISTHTVEVVKNAKKASKKINRMVKLGWEFVSLHPGNHSLFLVFRRDTPEPARPPRKAARKKA